MNSSARQTLLFVLMVAAIALAARWYWSRPQPGVAGNTNSEQTRTEPETLQPDPGLRPPSAPESEADVGVLGKVRISDDAAAKRGDFWLEQTLELPPYVPHGQFLDLYVTLDPKTAVGVRVRLTGKEAVLERLTGEGTAPEVLGRAPVDAILSETVRVGGEQVLGALWRAGELSIWWNGTLLLAWQGQARMDSPSGAAVAGGGLKTGPRRAMALGRTAFRDSFMREKAGFAWRPASGKWELTQMAFPERSANPFALRTSFGNEAPASDRLYQGRLRTERYGIGVMIGEAEGTTHIVRITGGSPAARAGLQEDDTIIELEGEPIDQMERWRINQLLYTNDGGRGGALRLKILRPGEKSLREFTIPRDQFVWGTPMTGVLVQPVSESPEALILGGEAGWSDYAAEVCVKPLGAGACGLAIAATSPQDCLLLRWLGPEKLSVPQTSETNGENVPVPVADQTGRERIQLVRIERGAEKILAEKPMAYRPYEFYRLSLDWSGAEVVAKVDGVELFRAQVQALRRGQVGLYAAQGDPVFFDDVAVSSDRAELGGGQRPERRINEIFAAEQDMERWANPALEWYRDEATGWAVHTCPFPGTQALALNRPKFEALELALRLDGLPDAAGRSGARLALNGRLATLLTGNGTPSVSQEIPGGPYQRMAVRADNKEVVLDLDGRTFVFTRPFGEAAHDGVRLAIRGLRNLGDPRTVRAAGSGVQEYTFDNAPADWKVACGRWGLLNKWICDPRWSWFGGRSSGVAAIWNKQIFSGDQTVDAHVALMMEQDDPPYERAGDYNLVLCGDGVHLDRGYTLIFGGGRNYWTRLYRNGKMVAESREEAFRLPSDRVRQLDKPELHQRWFHLRLEKKGAAVSFYRDGRKAFTFTDPEPIPEGRTGFWTMDNGVLLSRLRIASTAVRHGPLESRESVLHDDGVTVNLYEGEIHTRVEPEALPREISQSLLSAPAMFKPASAAPVKEFPPVGAARAWRVINGMGGGAFALQWKKLRADPATACVLRFAMRIEPGAAVDLYMKDVNNGELFRWRITGPEQEDDGLPVVGALSIPADGHWHTVQINLLPGWEALWKRRGQDRPPHPALRPFFGAVTHHDYAVAGFGGNQLGAKYAVSDLTFLRAEDIDFTAPKLVKCIWPFDAEGDGRSLKLVFDDGGGSGLDPSTVRLNLSGTQVPQDFQRYDPPTQTVTIDLVAWRAGKPFEPGQAVSMTLEKFADRAGNPSPNPQPANWTFTLEQAAAARKSFDAPVLTVLMDADAPSSARGMRYIRPPGKLELAEVWPVTGALDASIYDTPAAPPWASRPGSVRVASLRDGSTYGFRLRSTQYSLNAWPWLAIEYRIPSEVPVNMHFNDPANPRRARQTVLLTDLGEGEDARGNAGRPGLGDFGSHFHPPPEGFAADGTWRRTELPLLKYAAVASPEQGSWELSNLDFREGGYRGNRRGMAYEIHKVEALPAARSRGIAFRWVGRTLVAAEDFASVLDDKPDTVPEVGRKDINPLESVEGAARRKFAARPSVPGEAPAGPLVSDGWQYLHVRLKNAAGAWSETLHYKFRIDNTPPRVVKTLPAAGEIFAGRTLRIFLADDHVVALDSLQLRVNGQQVPMGEGGFQFDPQTGELVYDDSRAAQPVNWNDGSQVRVALTGLADHFGNLAPEPYVFGFAASRASDTQGPAVAKIRFAAPDNGVGEGLNRPAQLEISMALNFEETLGHVRALQDCRLDWIADPKLAAFGRRAARFVMQDDGADARIMLHKNAWYMDQYTHLHFDYKAEPGVNVDLQALVLGEWYTFRFLGDGVVGEGEPAGESSRDAGSIEGVKADGQWRHATINLRQALERAAPRLPVRIISQLRFSSRGRAGAVRGASLSIDNLALAPESGSGGRIEWEAEADPSGISGYSLIVDRSPSTEAPKIVTTLDTAKTEFGRSGTWYVHVRACDQAGNWGPTRHYRVDF